MVSQHEARAELYTRRGDHWEYREVAGLDAVLTLPSVEVTLAMSDIYALVEWDEEAAAQS